MWRNLIIACSGAGLLACSSVSVHYTEGERLDVSAATPASSHIDSLIAPYRSELEAEMSEVIAQAPEDLIKDRPNGNLNNWVTDALLREFSEEIVDMPCMVLLNYGGLRNPIGKGDVTVGDIFKLMPFDNEVVIVTLPLSALGKMAEYIGKSGGEPIAGIYYRQGKMTWEKGLAMDEEPFLVVITSDYLLNGGDNMQFFSERREVIYTGQLMRDVLINQARKQKTLRADHEERITF